MQLEPALPPTPHQAAHVVAQGITSMVMEALETWREQALRDQRALFVQALEEAITAPDAARDSGFIARTAAELLERWECSKLVRTREAIGTIDPHFIVDYPNELPALGRIMGEIFDEATDLLREEIERSVADAKRSR